MRSQDTAMPETPIALGDRVGQDIPDSRELVVGVESSAVSDVILIDDQLGDSGGTHAPHRLQGKYRGSIRKKMILVGSFFLPLTIDR